jgi:copper chaperone
MIAFDIPEMSCGHCKSTIEAAIRSVDPTADITIDLRGHTARIATGQDAGVVARAIESAGYAVTPIA